MRNIIVGVSGINAVDNPGPGIGVARSLKEARDLNVRIVGLAYDAMDPGIYMDWVVDKSFIMPYPSGSGEAYMQRLLQIKDTHGLDHVVPNCDAELPFYMKYSDRLRENGIRTFLPTINQFRLRGKDRLAGIASMVAIDLPETEVVTSCETLRRAVERIGLPVMVKGCFYKAHRANTMQEAVEHYNHLVAEWGYPVIVQDVVAGDELNVVGLGDGTGAVLGLVAIKKIWITALGKMWTGVTVRHGRMLAAAKDFVRRTKWRGPFELECIVSGDTIYLIEINPRFPAWSYCATGVGLNLPARLLRCSLGMPVSSANGYKAGKLFVRYSSEIVTDMADFRQLITRGETP